MNNRGIDDIRIDVNYKQNNGSNKGTVIFWIVLLIIFCGLLFYKYYSKNKENSISKKNLFMEQLSRTNINKIIENELYEKIRNGLLNDSYQLENNITINNNNIEDFDSKYFKGLDFSNFVINVNTKRNSTEKKSFSEGSIEYSGNDVLDFKIVRTKNELAVYSKDIYDKYISTNYDDINKLLNSNYNTNLLKDENKLELSKTDIQGYFKEYKDIVLKNLKEEYFSIDNNVILKRNESEIEVTSYILELSNEELNSILIELLENLKKDDELIDNIISGKDESLIFNLEGDVPTIQNIKVNGQEVTSTLKTDELKKYIFNIFIGKKLDISYRNFIQKINGLIEYLKNNNKDGLKVNIYATDKKIEKIRITFDNSKSIEIEFPQSSSSKENNISITYIKNESKDGFSLEINKTENSASLLYNMIYNFIEQGRINRKISIDLKTDGTVSSNIFSNDLIISYLTNNGDAKCVIKNNIKFVNDMEIDELNEMNCLYLSKLNEPDFEFYKQDLHNKIIDFYNSKREKLNFIDINTITGQNNISSVTVDEARNALYNEVVKMMTEFAEAEQEFTLQNLEGLTIDGYDVSVNINEENAIIMVDVYMFKIDKEFNMSDM